MRRPALRAVAAFAAAALMLGTTPARAARPLPDSGKWDRTFALYARDAAVPWKRVSVRLDTYSGATVDFTAYEVDPADVLVAGKPTARAVDTTHRKPVARWRFTPPPGLRYTPNDVEVPLQNREGFYVIEARRGDAVQQTWIDLTRIGLLTKESPGGVVLYGADLGTGRALAGMRVTSLVGNRFAYGKTDAHGIERWNGAERPRFALAEWGKSRAFVSLLPQPPVPPQIVAVRVDRASVRAGERVRVVGFARKRTGTAYRPAAGDARISIVARGRTLAATEARLDQAGAFSAELALPADAPAGDAAVLAGVGAGNAGASLHIDGVGDVVLSISAACSAACTADAPIGIAVVASRAPRMPAGGRDVRVRVVRSPHVPPPDGGEVAAWGTTVVLDEHVRTDEQGLARVTIPAPTDGLASTYGVTASAGAATAGARLVAPTARVALAVRAESEQIEVGGAASLDVRGFDAVDGHPAAGLAVRVRLLHGPTEQEQRVTLGADGHARVLFRNVVPGTNLLFAQADVDGKTALDVTAVTAAPQALLGTRVRRSAELTIALDRTRYRPGDRMTVDAALPGAAGDAFISLDGARALGSQTVPAAAGRARAAFTFPESVGDAEVGVAFVRDGALEYATRPVDVDGPGHARVTVAAADRAVYAPGETAHIKLADGAEHAGATLAIRVSDQAATGGATFADAPGALAGTGTTTQDPASPDPGWHASVTPSRSTAIDYAANGTEAPAAETLGAASAQALSWRIDRGDREGFDVALPRLPGRYVVSVLKISDDGDVGAASTALEVR